MLLDETVVATRDLTPRCSYSDFTVCPASLDETLQVDTRAVANGPHRLTLRVQDAAGNERVVHGERPVEVANEPTRRIDADVLGHREIQRHVAQRRSRCPMAVASWCAGASRRRRSRSGPALRSRFSSDSIARERVSRWRRASRPKPTAPSPPSSRRTVPRGSCVWPTAQPTATRSSRGPQGASAGGIAIARVAPRTGRALQRSGAERTDRQARQADPDGGTLARSAWTQFKSLRTDRIGRFSGTYRLRVRRPGVVLKIRAVVPSEAGYGYLTSRSRAITLRVR